VLANSTFSYAAALLSNGTVYRVGDAIIGHKPLDHWLDLEAATTP
jgi:hypothetical protein